MTLHIPYIVIYCKGAEGGVKRRTEDAAGGAGKVQKVDTSAHRGREGASVLRPFTSSNRGERGREGRK